jgi:outer membrane protein assembly complex protein YaeT
LRAARLGRLALAAAILLPAARARAEELLGRTIVSVSCVADGPFKKDEVEALVTLKAGRPLSEEETAATLRNLYATGHFSDARIEAVPEGDGVAVTVVLFAAYRIHPLVFAGTLPVSRAELRKALPFAPDALYSDASLADGAEAIVRRLQAEGYLSARVSVDVALDRARFRARVTYSIQAGPAALAAAPLFDGDTAPFSEPELAASLKLKPGTRFRESVARADATRLTEFLHGRDYYRALVELIAVQPVDGGQLMPVYRLRVGPRVVFEATGMKPKKLAKELHSLAETQPIEEELVLQYVEGHKEALQRSGHYRATVNYVFDARSDPSVTRIAVDVVEGPKFFVEAVKFTGNSSVPDRKLYDLMATHRKGLPLLAPGRLVDTVLAADAETILAYYQSEGFIRAKVPPPHVENGVKPGGLVVTVAVTEGPQAFVEARSLEGAEHLDPETAAKLLRVKEGVPFNPNAVRQDVGAVTSWYHDHGFREAAVRDSMALSEDGKNARVTYTVEEGDKTYFGKTIVKGNTRTRTASIERLVAWKEGEPVSEAKILDTQRALSRAGVFRRVEVRPQRPDPTRQTRNVEVEVEEGRPWSLLYGVGYRYAPGAPNTTGGNTSDPYVTGGVSYNNILGRMISAGVEAQYAPFSRLGRLQVSLREPFFFGTSYPLNVFGFYSRELIQDVELERTGVAVNSSKIVARGLRVGLTTTYQLIRPTNPESFSVIDQIVLPAINRPIDEVTIGPDVLFDRRDDIIDPHKGFYLSAAYKYASAKPVNPPVAFPLPDVTVRFSKFSTQATGFLDLGRRWTLVASARVGGAFGVTPDDSPIPIAERFFGGGRSTERAFDTDLLGIPGTTPLDPNQTVDYSTIATPKTSTKAGSCATVYPHGFPNPPAGSSASPADYDCSVGPRIVGGKGFMALNVELRIPIAGNLGAVVFYDAAQVWRDLSQVTLRFEGESGLRQGAGFGLRFMTPIGPARVEYGWPLMARTIPFSIVQVDTDPRTGRAFLVNTFGQDTVRESGHFFFSIGYPF